MLKRFVGTRSLSVIDIPQYMNEFDELEDIYFGKKKIPEKKEYAKLTGLYKYCWWLKPPNKPSVHVPYNLLVYLARVAPKGSEISYITQKLRQYGYLKDEKLPDDLRQRIEYARNWARDFMEIKETAIRLSSQEISAVQRLIQVLQTDADENQIQSAIFSIAREHNIQPSRFFKTLYTMLLGVPEGPRLGPYIVAMGRQNVVDALSKVLKQ
jgi:lysyl-tRNA synthetase class 1